jgi:class 3 adenylate cyclase
MSTTKKTIKEQVEKYLDENFEIKEIENIPSIDDTWLTFGNRGYLFKACVVFIDLRGSTKLLSTHKKKVVAKIHSAYLDVAASIANDFKGEIRSYNGDSILIFFPGNTKQAIRDGVKTAMKIVHAINDESDGINTILKRKNYSTLNFGIGIDHGEILATKIGIKGFNNRDIFWDSINVNKAVKLSDKGENPYHIYISDTVKTNLLEEVQYHTKKDEFGYEKKIDMWQQDTFLFLDEYKYCYKTNYYWKI